MSKERSLELPDGRTLSYTTYNASLNLQLPVVFYFHGFPGTHDEGRPVYDAAHRRSILVVGVTRPSFGDSTQDQSRTLLSFPSDIMCLADHLGIQRFAIMGVSGGGPYALACLYLLPSDRLRSVAIVSGMWPLSLGTAGMMLHLRIMHNLALWVPGLVGWMVGLEMGGPAKDTEHPEKFDDLMMRGFRRWPEEDQEVVFGNDAKLFTVLSESSRKALKQGTGGFSVESYILSSPWGFLLEDLPSDGRLVIWHGGKDANVPISMADQAAKLMPYAKYHKYDDEAHVSLVVKYLDEILDELTKGYGA